MKPKRRRPRPSSLFVLMMFGLAAGCAPVPGLQEIGASFNQELRGSHNQTSATSSADPEPYFLGLALSGGGSRAANFSASVMWQLHQLGVLQHVQYISAVSGSALPAAYYSLFKHDETKWNERAVKETMSQCFECWAFMYLLNPVRLMTFLGTSYDRSDVMSRVFHDRVFDKRKFSDLNATKPYLLLNATNYVNGRRFLFDNDTFNSIRSDLGELPLADAVMASAAYPAGFRNVTLKDFVRSEQRSIYVHLFDGGVSDNLGIDTLLEVHERHVLRVHRDGREAFPNGCLFILVDAYTPYQEPDAETRPDTRRWYDVVIDSNVANASSIMLATKRRRALRAAGFDTEHWLDAADSATKPDGPWPIGLLDAIQATRLSQHPNDLPPDDARVVDRRRSKCKVWHISLTQIGLAEQYRPPGYQRLPELYRADFERDDAARLDMSYEEFSRALRGIGTRLMISSRTASILHTAGRLLVGERNTLRIVCGWLRGLLPQGPAPCRPSTAP